MNFEIRKVTYEDKKIIKECDGLLYKLISSDSKYDDNYNLKIELNSFEEDLKDKDNYIFVAINNDKVIGFIYGTVIDRKIYKDKSAKIVFLYVLDEYRNKSVGKNLINHLIKTFKDNGVKYTEVAVYEKNICAKEFYKKLGFDNLILNLRIDITKENA